MFIELSYIELIVQAKLLSSFFIARNLYKRKSVVENSRFRDIPPLAAILANLNEKLLWNFVKRAPYVGKSCEFHYEGFVLKVSWIFFGFIGDKRFLVTVLQEEPAYVIVLRSKILNFSFEDLNAYPESMQSWTQSLLE